MGLRFRKRVKVAPGLTFNLSWSDKNGVTTSSTVGVPGANVNVGAKKDGSLGVKRGTLGIPGSGVSYHENLDDSSLNNSTSTPTESNEYSEEGREEERLEYGGDSPKELSNGSYLFTAFYHFAHKRTINWLINFTILGGLFYLNR